ncbi:hypothetical protein DSL72_003585 [Monilinia vaccinii-corymbosi]|uniref:N-acetyltransferase domain-containing protein n=1 Tax=Monilinia vaccinii-corymbosi TaxID=61207 RepID=A0A8A3NTQ2_9HELO|nr:hypothetical protein DSL72_003585 [Monilinia vaccinii-corymbosi]
MSDEPKGEQTIATSHHRINGMFTLPEARGQGVEKALVEAALTYARRRSSSRSLYEKYAFVPFKEVPHGNTTVTLMKIPGWKWKDGPRGANDCNTKPPSCQHPLKNKRREE